MDARRTTRRQTWFGHAARATCVVATPFGLPEWAGLRINTTPLGRVPEAWVNG